MSANAENEAFTIRQATVADAPILAHQRCAMFRDMGSLREADAAALAAASAAYFQAAIPLEEYVAWLLAPAGQPDLIVAGGGMQLRRILPRPARGGGLLPPGHQGLIVNVYTEPDWRRRGLAERVMQTIIAWSRAHGVASLVLHAAPMGRPLYERLGFVASNEMSFPDLLVKKD